jgi:hypothetical protein
MSDDPDSRSAYGQDAEIAEYRALSVSAVVGLIFGLLAPTALIGPLLWGVPLLGVLISAVALRRIARDAPLLVGRKAALAGLMLSILFAAAAPANWFLYRRLVRGEARQFAGQWFDFLAHGRPDEAYQLKIYPPYRQPFDDQLRVFYHDNPRWQKELDNFVGQPLTRALLALGQAARVRHFETSRQEHGGQRSVVYQVYAVTYLDEKDGRKKTFFVGLKLERVRLDNGRANWYITAIEVDFLPDALKQDPHGGAETRTGRRA